MVMIPPEFGPFDIQGGGKKHGLGVHAGDENSNPASIC